ncbi:S1/P1 nuclease [Rufibacter glacialis]|uniref:S1/P1 nuclease n=1 Tax=Rufibacter glacialis TaxID=1259555 RepID=A0A5M8QLU9_9BACT|nr:S1/P1 nuclease [Rufibacter glacialis]KAA6435736.1 S1/P1 nuclease [Rufibacter glacialis]GGK66093.1 endonuclease [Rufibacter glacialis]
MRFFKRIILFSLFLYLPFQSMGWGMIGHRIVGEVADRHISSKTRKNIKKILGNESLAMASNWADFIKSDPAYDYLGNWHYINLKEGLSQSAVEAHLKQDTSTNAFTRINYLVAQLKKKDLPHAQQVMNLRLLIHFIGDVHQPMHVGRPEDLGGNRIRVEWFNQPSNLHRVWDSQLIEYQQLSYTEYATAINFTTKSQVKTWQSQLAPVWFFESYQIAQQLYKGISKPEEKLSYRYNFDYVDTLNEQLLKGGVRLAGVLDEIFG